MRNVVFLITILAAGGASAKGVTPTQQVSAPSEQLHVARTQRARAIANIIGQIQLDALLDRIAAATAPSGRKQGYTQHRRMPAARAHTPRRPASPT